MRVLILSAYDAPSHRYWRLGLERHLREWQFTQLALAPRYFSWRVRGNGLSWSQAPELDQTFDLILATSMVDLATLRGLRPQLCRVPSILYFHENQFAYPVSAQAVPSVEPQLVSIYSALAADALVFNSAFNQQTFMTGAEQLLRQLPDQVPPNLVNQFMAKSRVLPVPIALPSQEFATALTPCTQPDSGEFNLIWNHRWEYDKGPERLLALVNALPPQLPLRWHIIGQQFRQIPAEFAELKQRLEKRGWLGHWGFIAEPLAYQQVLARGFCVVSTALHDFQGLAMLEAVAAGCIPLAPKRLAYPEWFVEEFCYPSHKDITQEAAAAAVYLTQLCHSQPRPQAPAVTHLAWPALLPVYRQLFDDIAARR